MFLHVFSMVLFLFIMVVILSNAIKSKGTRIFVNAVTILIMSAGCILGLQQTVMEWDSIIETLSKDKGNIARLFFSLYFNQWVFQLFFNADRMQILKYSTEVIQMQREYRAVLENLDHAVISLG